MPVPGRAGMGTGTKRAAEDAWKGPRSRAASCRGVLWWLREGRGGGMLSLLLEFLWGLPRLLSAGSSRQSWSDSPRLQMKVRAARGGDGGEGVGFAPSFPEQHCTGPAGGCPLAWQQPHNPSSPGTPTLSPGSASPAVTHSLHQSPHPPSPALAQPGCSSLNPTGVFGGHLAAHAPWEPAGCQNASSGFGGFPLKWCQAGKGMLLPSSHHPFCPQGG